MAEGNRIMTIVTEKIVDVGGVATRLLDTDPQAAKGACSLLLHGGAPGVTPYCGGAHLWGGLIDTLARTERVVAPDLLASGGTGAGEGPLTVDRMVAHVTDLIDWIGQDSIHLVGHDLGGMVALLTAIKAPERVASLTIVASQAASPTGDGVENFTFLAPPLPLWSRESQSWAYDRLCYSQHSIDEPLLEASVSAALKPGHSAVAGPRLALDGDLATSILRAKSRFFRVAREEGVKVPVQIIWGKNDPLVSLDHGVWLFRIIAARQPSAQFHVINRSGSFPWRDQAQEFNRVLAAFHGGLREQALRSSAVG